MNISEPYVIAFAGLKPGMHSFAFTVGPEFFESVKDTEIREGEVAVSITLIREERMMDIHFEFDGIVKVPCDRCNELTGIEVKGTERLIVKLGDRYYEESEDVQVIPEGAHHLDLSSFIYEYIHLLLPYRKVHPDDENGISLCDPEVLRKLDELAGHHETDPRWEALNKLKLEN